MRSCYSVWVVVALVILVLLFLRNPGREPENTSSSSSTSFSDNSIPFNQRIIDYCSNLEYDFNRSDTCPLAEDIVRSAVTRRIYFDHKDLSPALLHLLFHDCFIQIVPSLSNYDYFLLAQQWPPTVCMNRRRCAHKHLPYNFTIHGLWPTNTSWPYPFNCSPTSKFEKLDSSLEDLLRIDWPDLVNGNDEKFWADEWIKHGTCSLNKFQEVEYFELALKIKKGINLIDILKRAGIEPRERPYPIADIRNAIKEHNNDTEPRLLCFNQTKRPYSYLKEIRVCLDSNGISYINCPKRKPINCSEEILLPLSKHNNLVH